MSYDPADAASRAGVEPVFVDRLVQLGILRPKEHGKFSTGDIRRLALIRSLELSGLPLDGIAAAVRDGQLSLAFMDASSNDRFSTLSQTTFADLSVTTEVPVELLLVIREAVGFAEPSAEDRVRDIELRIAPVVAMQVAEGFRPAAIERWLRVYGESMRRIAETEADWWTTEVEQRLMDSGMSAGEMMEHADADIAPRMAPLLDDAVLAMYHGHQEHTWTTSIISGVEAALAEAGVFSRLEHPPAICFLDLTGYTRLTDQHGTTLRQISPAGWARSCGAHPPSTAANRLSGSETASCSFSVSRAEPWSQPSKWWRRRAASDFLRHTWAYMPGLSCSKKATTSGRRSTWRLGSPTMLVRPKCSSAKTWSTLRARQQRRSPKSARSS